MSKLKLILGIVWAFPITIFAMLFYALPFTALKWYKFLGFIDSAWVFVLNSENAPEFVKNYWKRWGGHAAGNVIVLRQYDESNKANVATFVHEMNHVHQCMRLGIFQPILYGLAYIAIKLGCTESDPYFSNPFEIDSRRVAGQVVDVEGYVKKLHASKDNRS